MDSKNEQQLTDQVVATSCAAGSVTCPLGNDAGQGQGESGATQPTRLCAHCKRLPRRKHQAYCLTCHRASMKVYRARQHREFAWLKMAVKVLTTDNSDTRARFAATVGDSRVIVEAKPGDQSHDYATEVIGYLPEQRLSVLDERSFKAGKGAEGNSHEIRNEGSTMKKEKHGI